ncbi:MAG: hypothetical protein ACRC7C_06970, partial [Beijerinckiaceae bacterium]
APAALACGPAHLTPATVARTAPEGDILLQDGKTLRLAGLQPMAAAGGRPGPGERIAYGLIAEEPDRWGRLPALVFVADAGGGWALLHEMAIRAGVRVRPEAGLGDCLPLLSRLEAKAPPAPHGESGRFDRVEARVQRVGEGRSALFIWLPQTGSIRTMGVVQKRHLARFATAGVDVKALAGKTIRLRGVRGIRNTASVAVTGPEQIEIIR